MGIHSPFNYEHPTHRTTNRNHHVSDFLDGCFCGCYVLGCFSGCSGGEAKIIDNVPEKLGNLLNSVLEFKGQVLNVVLSPFHYVAGTLFGSGPNASPVAEVVPVPAPVSF